MFDVRWTSVAQAQLWSIWARSDDDLNAEVASAMRRIDAQLRVDPGHKGESRDEGRRVLIAEPLTVFFRVLPDERLVRITAVHLWERR